MIFFFFNSLPNDKIVDNFQLTALADDKRNVIEMTKFVLDRIEKVLAKGENTAYQHFLPFLQRFQKSSFTGLLKVGIFLQRLKNNISY